VKKLSPAAAGLFVLNSSSYIESMMKTIPVIVSIAVLFFGCSESDEQPLEKADRLSQQALVEMNKQNYEEAERLLAECVEIHTGTNNETKLAENYSTLASVQLLSGKLTPGLETLAILRGIYQRFADRNSELQSMLQIGKVYFRLGRTEEAFAILTEAFNNSKLLRLDQIAITSAIDLSTMYSAVGRHEKALTFATHAYQMSKEQRNGASMVEALNMRIYSFASLGNAGKSFELFREAEAIVLADKNINAAKFYLENGKAFARAEEWSFAKRNYERAVSLAGQALNAEGSSIVIDAKIGLGEIFFHHYAFSEAQQQFVQAYNLAKSGSDGITQSYLLVRAADCLEKRSAYIVSQDGIIRATQLYEQAQTLFSRNGFPFGEAITLHRLGMVKELTGDDNAAMTFYKRAYDKFSDNDIDPRLFPLFVSIEKLYQTESTVHSPAEWFSQNLILLLLKYNRTAEAYSYLQNTRSISIQSRIFPLMLHFIDPVKNNRYSALQNTVLMHRQHLLELHQMNMLHQQSKNRNYVNKLQQQIAYTRSKLQSDAVTLAQDFPVFTMFTISHHSLQSKILNAIPTSQTLLEYFLADNEAWVFIARTGEELNAIKLSSYGYALEKKMDRYCSLLYSSPWQEADLHRLSNELFEFLIRPIELSGTERVMIIPPLQFDQFPFHSLTDDGVPVLEKTGISYLPHASFVLSAAALPKYLNNITAFGFTPNSRWGLEFELRDIRSFFGSTQVNINQTATRQRLESSAGELLQISSQYMSNADNEAWFTLSDGSTSKAGINIPVSQFTDLHPYPIVYLSDVQSTVNNITSHHPLLWLLNGSASVVTTQFPITPNVSKTFGENFYASLASEVNPYLAYRRAAVYLGKNKTLNGGFGRSAYFYYGVK
jgi:tetratricopeptide (TPR) repeat protein